MKIVRVVALLLGTVLAGCGTLPPRQPSTIDLTLPGGQRLAITVLDPEASIEGIAARLPQRGYHEHQKNGLALQNADGDPTRLLVTWIGVVCEDVKVEIAVAKRQSGFALSLREPRTLQSCGLDAGTIKTIELKFLTAVPEGFVTGTLLLDP